MRVLAGHDLEGNIQYVVVSPADAPPATVTTETGLLVTEVEAPEAIAGLDLSGRPRVCPTISGKALASGSRPWVVFLDQI
jgi:hypothetical protein